MPKNLNSRYKRSFLSPAAAAALIAISAAGTPASAADPAACIPSPPYAVASATLGSRLEAARKLAAMANYRGVIDELQGLVISSDLPLPPEAEREFLKLLGKAYYETGNPAALQTLDRYASLWPAAEGAMDARLLSADFYFFAHDWSRALETYRILDADILDSSRRDLYTYREALCLIKCGFYDEARPLLTSLRKSKDFAAAAKYYEAYIHYLNGNDSRAMELFRSVLGSVGADDPEICPDYYIAQLLFRQGNWTECSRMAARLLKKNVNPELAVDTRRVYGMSQYELGDYQNAAPILERYVKEAGESSSHDALYALGVCRYDEGEYARAEDCFARVAADHDAVGQGASLYLGMIAARRDEASAAAINFERAYRMNYDNGVAESALYNYVAARAKGGNVPFDSNVEMLEEFIRNYPNSEYAPVIERHLATLYYNDGDYDNALRIADRIRRPSKADTALLQMILYSGGTSALSSGNPSRAAELLQKCVNLADADASVRVQARIWLGDALYELHKYREAEQQYATALKSGKNIDNALQATYSMGYAQMMQNKFRDASATFGRVLSSGTELPDDLRRDTRLRLADCKYYGGNYSDAKSDFASLRSGGHGADYATYRHAQILGIEGDLSGKIEELRSIERNFSDSPWLQNALKELAETYVATGRNSDAAAAYSRMLHRYPQSQDAPAAQLGMAAALMDSGDETAAAEAYKEILKKWPASTQARLADEALREYYADTGELASYARFLKSVSGFSLNATEMERLAYAAAERHYLNDSSSPESLRKYLREYPSGAHAAEAWSLLARHYHDAGDRPNALAAYRELEQRGGTRYAAEAYTGIMRTADNSGVRADYARRLLNSGGAAADAREEAEFYMTEALLGSADLRQAASAETTLRRLASNPFSEFGARSAVTLGEYLLRQGRVREALSLMEDFTSSGSGQQYWVARGFIVMADAYSASGDEHIAREYLQSLKRNYPGDEADIRNAINSRLNK